MLLITPSTHSKLLNNDLIIILQSLLPNIFFNVLSKALLLGDKKITFFSN